MDELLPCALLSNLQFNCHGSEVVGVSKAVNAAYAGNYYCVVSTYDAGYGVHTHFFYLLINGRVFFDVHVLRWQDTIQVDNNHKTK